MRNFRKLEILAAAALCVSAAWGQGGRRGNAAAQPGAPAATPPAGNAAGRAGRGAPAAAPASSASEFYNYDTSATAGLTIPDSPPVETHQKITANGQPLAYTTRAGFLALHNATTGQAEAHIFYTAYHKDGVSDASTRPICFFLGGAPGVSAAWQEFGGLGPKRLEGNAWTENPNTLLGSADLVFANPVGTGFSRPDQPSRAPNFFNSTADVASLAEFVRSYLGLFNRTTSPLILAGEDFGTGRVAGLAAYLYDHQIPVHGVILLSMTMSADASAGDTQYLTMLPSLTMAAWHHKKLANDLNAMSAEQISSQARQFASREYLHALYKGDRMTADERAKVIADLSRFTGLPKSVVVSNGLRVPLDRFVSELLREQHGGLSMSDARVSGFVPLPAAGGRGGGGGGFGGIAAPPIDFNLSALSSAFLPSYEAYLHRELTFAASHDEIFYLTSGGVSNFTAGSDDANLSAAFARNPKLHLFVSVNYYDLAAPFYAAEYTLAHLNVSPEVRSHNITVSHLEAGQMPYTDGKAMVKLGKDLGSFVTQAATH